MIYLFEVYVLVIVLVFGSASILFLTAATAVAVFKALRSAAMSILPFWQNQVEEPFSVSRHLKSRNVLDGGAV